MSTKEITVRSKFIKFVRKSVFFWYSFGLIILVVSLCLYFTTMSSKLSKNSDDWSNFGSFIGGIVGTILTAINFLTLIILTWQTKDQQNHEWITSIRINKYHDLINALKDNTDPQKFFISKNLDDDFFLFGDNYEVLLKIERLLKEEYTIQTKEELLVFLKAIIKSEQDVIKEFIFKYKSSSKKRKFFQVKSILDILFSANLKPSVS